MVMMDFMKEKNNKRHSEVEEEDYILALEEERRKIQVFQRELPLCLDLVDQAIDNCRRKRSECEEEEEQTSSEVPVLEEFIPIRRSSTSSSSPSPQNKSNNICKDKIEKKVDWLRSVQLWNQDSDSLPSLQQQDTRPPSIGIKENGGAFLPFQSLNKETTATTTTTTSVATPVPTASTSSTADNNSNENNNKRKQEKEKESQLNRKSRRCWSPELHRRFLQSLQQLGGSHAATPKQIRELMKVDGLTNDEVKSHLQKYRLHTRRPGPSGHNNGSAQPTQFVVVGGIWVPPPQNYTAASASKEDATSTAPERVYAPVAALPQQRNQLQLSTGSSHSEQKSSRGERSIGDDNPHLSSPAATSSSTETTTASPNF